MAYCSSPHNLADGPTIVWDQTSMPAEVRRRRAQHACKLLALAPTGHGLRRPASHRRASQPPDVPDRPPCCGVACGTADIDGGNGGGRAKAAPSPPRHHWGDCHSGGHRCAGLRALDVVGGGPRWPRRFRYYRDKSHEMVAGARRDPLRTRQPGCSSTAGSSFRARRESC